MDKADVADIKRSVQEVVAARLPLLGDDERAVEEIVRQAVEEMAPPGIDEDALAEALVNDYLRLGPLEPLLADAEISEIMVNGGGIAPDGSKLPPKVFVETGGVIRPRPDVAFDDDEHVMRVIARIGQAVGRACTEASPLMDARLADGSRVNATHGSVSVDGPTLNIRRFRDDARTPAQLVAGGTCTQAMMDFLRSCVQARLNIVVSGGTGSGKTTLLNVLASYIPAEERVVTVEDAAELKLGHPNLVRMEARPAGPEGAGAVTIHDLVVNALRQRPDRIVVGECRSSETVEMLQAMQTGHDGSLTTVHANSPASVFNRIETMVVTAQPGFSLEAVDRQIADAVDLVVHTERCADGARRITHVMAVEGYSDGVIVHSDLFAFRRRAASAPGEVAGSFEPCGMQPSSIRARMEKAGAPYDASWFFDGADAL